MNPDMLSPESVDKSVAIIFDVDGISLPFKQGFLRPFHFGATTKCLDEVYHQGDFARILNKDIVSLQFLVTISAEVKPFAFRKVDKCK